MRTRITLKYLNNINACEGGIKYYNMLGETNLFKLIEKGIEDSKFDYCNWLIARCMSRKQCLMYALHAAESVLHLYEDKYPNDNRPRLAIESVKAVIRRDNKKNRVAAYDAGYAGGYAAWSTGHASASRAAGAAARAAGAAARAAGYAADTATWAYAAAACTAGADAGWDTRDARADHMTKILRYGMEMMKGAKQ